MTLDNTTYYTPEANAEYMSCSQFKAFLHCEAAAGSFIACTEVHV